MIKIEKILFPTDFSNCARHAMGYALELAEQYKAKLFVLHVVPNVYLPTNMTGLSVPLSKLYGEMERSAKERIKKLVPKRFLEKIEIENIVVRGVPFLEIIKKAKEHEVDLIVISTHGWTGLKQAIFGSTAEKVVRKSPCPVLTVRYPEHEFVMP